MNALTAALTPENNLFSLLNPFIRLFEGAQLSWKAMIQSTAARTPDAAFAMEESDATYLLKAFLPGAIKDAVQVDVCGEELRVKATCETRYTDGRAFSYVRQKAVDERFHLPADALQE